MNDVAQKNDMRLLFSGNVIDHKRNWNHDQNEIADAVKPRMICLAKNLQDHEDQKYWDDPAQYFMGEEGKRKPIEFEQLAPKTR